MGHRNIVVLGASYAGTSIAHSLLQHTIPALHQQHSGARYRVVLVSASKDILCRPACPRAMLADELFDQGKLFVGVEKSFQRYDREVFRFVHGKASGVDLEARKVEVQSSGKADKEVLDFHALVVATGATAASPLLGLSGDAEELRQHWRRFREALKTARSVLIAGGGPAGIETAGEIGEYLNGRAGWFGSKLEDPKVKINVVTAGKQILPILRPALAEKAEAMLAKVGVDVINGVRVEKVEPEHAGTGAALTSKATVTLSDGRAMQADLYIPATGLTPNTSFLPPDLLTPDGRVDTDTATLRVPRAGPRVYALGDASAASRPAIHNILDAVPVLHRSMKADLLAYAQGRDEAKEVQGSGRGFLPDEGETQLVPVGRRGGVGAMKGWRLPGWVVWLVKGRDYWLWTTGRLWSGKQWEKEG